MEKISKISSLVQFANKAGRLSIGLSAVLKSVLYKKAKLIIIASDCGSNVKRKLNNALKNNRAESVISDFDMDSLGRILNYGKVSIISVNDENFAKGIMKKIKNE